MRLGYVIDHDLFVAVPAAEGWSAAGYRMCANHDLIGCNWLIAQADPAAFCVSCRHTLVIPDLELNENVDRWAKLEGAKRMLLYGLHKFHLAMPDHVSVPQKGLRFEFKADQSQRNRIFRQGSNGP